MPRVLSSTSSTPPRRSSFIPRWAHNFRQPRDESTSPASASSVEYRSNNSNRYNYADDDEYHPLQTQQQQRSSHWSIIMPSMTNTSSSGGSSSQAEGLEAPSFAPPSTEAPPPIAHYQHAPAPQSRPRTYNVETTADGDVVVVEPSFDEAEEPSSTTTTTTSSPSTNPASTTWEQQSRSPVDGDKSRSPGRRASPAKSHHTRNLSAHFFDATKLTTEENPAVTEPPRYSQGIKHDVSPVVQQVGQKHRRMFSGDVSNPPLAHRRINSIGNAAAVERSRQNPRGGKRHSRDDSAGLDILSAAANVSKDELAAAAGAAKPTTTTSPWEPPSGYAPPPNYPPSSTGAPLPPPPPPPIRSVGSSSGQPMKPPPSRTTTYAPPPGVHGHAPPVQHYVHPSMPPTVHYHHHPPHPYHHASYYAPPPGTARHPVRYPVQYAPPPPPSHHVYKGPQAPPPIASSSSSSSYGPPPTEEQPTGERQPSPATAAVGDEKIESDQRLFGSTKETWRNGTNTQQQGVQTFVTAISVADGTRTLQPSNAVNEQPPPLPSTTHHRKLSSFSSLGGTSSIFSPTDGSATAGDHPLKTGHHRVTSSTVSFLQGLDVLEGSDVTFLRNLHASTPSYGGGGPLTNSSMPNHVNYQHPEQGPEMSTTTAESCKLAAGGTSKRVRRKCSVEGCPNRVVQGGLCISHGAKRKTCKHPGCTKNVKKAGLCSTHGPARKRCEAEGCTKVAVQGGKCIAHGAKKKLCSVESCKKQAILSGMCKKHHDKLNGIAAGRSNKSNQAKPTSAATTNAAVASAPSGKAVVHKPSHTRGLSIFQDLTADAVSDLLADEYM